MKERLVSTAISLLVGCIVAVSFSAGLFAGLENFFEDLLFSPQEIDREIVILEIDSDSLQKIGQWPWPREVFGNAFLELDKNRPKAVGLDVVFAEDSRLGGKDDAALASALRTISYPVVMPVEAQPLILEAGTPRAEDFLRPLRNFTESKNVSLGHVNLILDADGIMRRIPPAVDGYRAFSYEVAKRSGRMIPREDSLRQIERIVFAGPTGSIRRIPFWRIFEDGAGRELQDQIVLIGATSPDLHDEKPTPLSKGTQMPGVEIQANVLNMILSGHRLSPPPAWASYLWIFLAAIIPALVFSAFRNSLPPLFINIFFGFAYLVAVIVLFERGIAANLLHITFAWSFSTAGIFAYRYFSVERERKEMKGLFSKYVSKHVLEEILKDPSQVKLGGEEKEVTVFFSDIRGFTTLSEKTTPTELVHILNEYFTLMTEEVLKTDGVLDKYIGDAIMAFWGAPIEDPNQADNALKASIAMTEKLKILNKELREKGEPEIGIGIGLYTGPAVVGNVGSNLRFDYTVIGDTVNVASRLEGLNKEFKTQIIIGETTKNKIKGKYNFKSLGSMAVKGRKESLNIYTVEI